MTTPTDAQSEMRQLLHEACPERWNEIDSILNRHRVKFIYDLDGSSLAFEVRMVRDHAEICVPTWASVSLWAHTSAYLAVYDATCEASHTQSLLLPSAQRALRRAQSILDWVDRLDRARPEDRETILRYWPKNEPRPFSDSKGSPTLVLAEHLTWMATAAILLHEIGHLEKRHFTNEHAKKRGAEVIPLEIEADEWARRFLMDKWPLYCENEYADRPEALGLVKTKRLLGPIIGFLYLVRHEQLKGVSDEHPRSYERLIACVGDFVEDPNDLIWAIVQAVFWVHLNRAQPNCDSGVEYESFRECAIALAVELEGTAQ